MDKDSVDPLYDGLLDEEEDGGGLQFMGPVRDDLMNVDNPTAEEEMLSSPVALPFSEPFTDKVVTSPKKVKAISKKTSTSSEKILSASSKEARLMPDAVAASSGKDSSEGVSWKKPARLSGEGCEVRSVVVAVIWVKINCVFFSV